VRDKIRSLLAQWPSDQNPVDLSVTVGSRTLASPVMAASGTAGHGAELGSYFDLADAGAIVVKSLLHEPWAGNPAPRVHSTDAGMINSVGLQGPGVQGWIVHDLAPLVAAGCSSQSLISCARSKSTCRAPTSKIATECLPIRLMQPAMQ
jgi:dihydroorotate dehydrogenase (NAD+) catalytic subunit